MAITQSPLYPGPGVEVTVSDAAIEDDVQVLELTSVPSESELELGLQFVPVSPTPTSAIDIAERDAVMASFTPDVPGDYGVRLIGIRHYPGDGVGGERFEIIDTSTGTVNVGGYVRLPIVDVRGHGATLRMQVVHDTIRAAELVEPTTDLARVAALSSGVIAALATMVGSTIALVGTELQAGVDDLRTNYEAHRVNTAGSVHTVADAVNVIDRGATDSEEDAIQVLNQLRTLLVGHLRDSTKQITANEWHNVNQDDGKNVPLAPAASNKAQATVLSADLRERVYERHRVQTATPSSHDAADSTNALAAPRKLDDLIVAFFDVLAAATITAPAGEVDGAVDAAHRYGFKSE